MTRQSPLQNRVLPSGEIVSQSYRGGFTGNRGILTFDASGCLGTARWKHQHWIICTLTHPRGRYHGPQPERAWTPLFFTDEAVGLAAGHRPCAYCRREAFDAWRQAWIKTFGDWPGHKIVDQRLHGARVMRNRTQVRYSADIAQLPDGSFILWQDKPHLLWHNTLIPWHQGAYGAPCPRPSGSVTILTPAPTIAVLDAGYVPEVGISA